MQLEVKYCCGNIDCIAFDRNTFSKCQKKSVHSENNSVVGRATEAIVPD